MNYFKEKKAENDETLLREEEKSRTSLYDSADYNIKLVNKILNKSIPTEADKYNIARVIEWFDYNLRQVNDCAVKFEKIVKDTLGEDVYNVLAKKYVKDEMKQFEERING